MTGTDKQDKTVGTVSITHVLTNFFNFCVYIHYKYDNIERKIKY